MSSGEKYVAAAYGVVFVTALGLGQTGLAAGPHLHFEVRLFGVPQNPARFLASS